MNRRDFLKTAAVLLGTPLYRKLFTAGGIGAVAAAITWLTPKPAHAVGTITPYSPFGFDYGVAFMATAPSLRSPAITLPDGDDYNLGTDYGAAHIVGHPNHGFVDSTGLTKANFTVGLAGEPIEPNIAGSVRNINNGTQSAFQLDLSDAGTPDADGTRTFNVICAIGQAGTAAPTAAPYAQLVDGGTIGGVVKATRDGNGTPNELIRLGGVEAFGGGWGGTAQSGIPYTTPLVSNLNSWQNSYKGDYFQFSSNLLTIRLGPTTPRAGVSPITYLRVRRVHPTILPFKDVWEIQMRRTGHYFLNGVGTGAHDMFATAQLVLDELAGAADRLTLWNLASDVIATAGPGYYDPIKVWHNIYRYTGDPLARSILTKLPTAMMPFVYDYKNPAGTIPPHEPHNHHPSDTRGTVTALSLFTTGMRLLRDLILEETGNVENAETDLLRDMILWQGYNAAFCSDAELDPAINLLDHYYELNHAPLASWREASYALTAHIDRDLLNAQIGGQPPSPWLTTFRDSIFNNIQHWCIDKDVVAQGGSRPGTFSIQPFMIANGMVGLTRYCEHTGDESVLPYIKAGMDFLWANCWIPNMPGGTAADRAFIYLGFKSGTPPFTTPVFTYPSDTEYSAAWLNLLCIQPWGYYYHKTGNTTYRDQAIEIWQGAVVPTSPAPGGPSTSVSTFFNGGPIGKTFNQNFVKSFEFVEWMDPLAVVAGVKALGMGAGKTLSIKAGKTLRIKED